MTDNPNAGAFDVEVIRVFDAPVEQVWKLWSESEQVKKWWGPTGFTCPVANVDLREGGKALVAMRAPKELGMADMYSTWSYTKVVPAEMIEYEFRFSNESGDEQDPIAPGVPRVGHHRVVFEEDGDRTKMTMTEHGYTTAEARDLSRAGLEQCFDKMTDALKG